MYYSEYILRGYVLGWFFYIAFEAYLYFIRNAGKAIYSLHNLFLGSLKIGIY